MRRRKPPQIRRRQLNMSKASNTCPWLVWNPSASFPKYQHSTYEAARAEAERLARQFPGTKFFVMEAVGRALVEKPSIYEEFKPYEVPF